MPNVSHEKKPKESNIMRKSGSQKDSLHLG